MAPKQLQDNEESGQVLRADHPCNGKRRTRYRLRGPPEECKQQVLHILQKELRARFLN